MTMLVLNLFMAYSLVPIALKLEISEQIGTLKKKKNTVNLVPITWEQGWEQTSEQ
ncbi:hypothetical protein [Terrisporobacter petrolearius]|uniref:hypothetical protein n=1 Tax=Terrisporobacter petrolearius TaxID=1460447 RepID=UPI003AFFA8D6